MNRGVPPTPRKARTGEFEQQQRQGEHEARQVGPQGQRERTERRDQALARQHEHGLAQDGATVRAADFNFGHTTRHGKTGRALVDDTKTLVINYAADWEVTRLGGREGAPPARLLLSDRSLHQAKRPGGKTPGRGELRLRPWPDYLALDCNDSSAFTAP